MFKKRKLAIMLFVSLILISSISVISAADSNSTDLQTVESEDIELEQVDSNQDVLSSVKSFSDLNNLINTSTDSQITLEDDYTYNRGNDDNSLTVNKDNIVIDGNGHTITGSTNINYKAYGFNVISKNVVIKNINFVDIGYRDRDGGAILSSSGLNNLTIINCTFKNCNGKWGGAISSASLIENCSFNGCYARELGGAISSSSKAINCNFTSCNAREGGAVSQCTSFNCNFINNYGGYGGAGRLSDFINCTFRGNSASYGGAVYESYSSDIINCTFINNEASSSGGAIYASYSYYQVINCTFEGNTANNYAATYYGQLVLCTFNNNVASGNKLQYEPNAIKKLVVEMPSSISITCPNQVVIPVNYVYKMGTGSIYTYNGKTYYFNNIPVTLKLYQGYSSEVIDTYECMSGSLFTIDLDKGTYTLKDSFSTYPYSSATCYIRVSGEQTNISADEYTERYLDEDAYLVVNLTGSENRPLSGLNVYLKENDTVLDVLATDENGQVRFSLNDLSYGTHNLSLEFLEDARHESSTLPVTVVVKKLGSFINAVNITAMASDDIKLIVNFTNRQNDSMVGYSLYLKENGTILDVLTTDSNGQVTFSLNDLSAGTHNLVVEFLEEENYSASSLPVSVVINRFATVIKADDVDAFVSDDLSLLVNLTDDENNPMVGYVVYLKEDGVVLDNLTTDELGQVNFSICDLSAGSHSLTVEFLGSKYYEGSMAPVTVVIDKFNTVISADNVSGFTYNDINLVATLTDGDNNPMVGYVVYLKEDGNVLSNLTTDDFGRVNFSLNDLSEGNHALYVEFLENRYYRGSELPVSAIIKKWDTVIKADNITAMANEDINLVATLTDGDNNPMVGHVVYLKEDGNVLANLTTDEFGRVSFSLNDIYSGIHVLYVEFLENKLYKGSSLPVSVVINRFSSSIKADNVTGYIVDDVNLVATLTDGDNGPMVGYVVYLKEDGNVLANLTTDESGKATFSLKGLSAGNHILYVEFLGTRLYEGSTQSVSAIIDKVDTIIKSEEVIAFPNEGKVVVKLTDQWGNPLSDSKVYLDLSFFRNRLLTSIGNGEFEFDLTGLATGEFTGKVTFNENDTHNGSSADVNVRVLARLSSNIYADDLTVFYDDSQNLIVYLKDDDGNPIPNAVVKLTVNSKRGSLRTNSEGMINFDLSAFNLPVGVFDATISHDLSNEYLSSSANVKITVNKLPTTIFAPNVVSTYEDGKNLVITLKDKNNKPVKHQEVLVKIDGRTISQGTDDNGQAKYVINLVPGNYTVEVIFEGTVFYDASYATANITVNQKTVTPIGNDTSGGNGSAGNETSGGNSSVSNDTSADGGNQQPPVVTVNDPAPATNQGDSITVTLKDDSGNPLANVDVIIELDGHSYNYKTNGKGQVKIVEDSLVPKTYNAKVTVLDGNKRPVSAFSIKIAVKKAKPRIIAKKKKFKAKKKVKKYTIYLKVGKKPIKRVKVTLKIKGKKYTAKTNKKGRAIFKLKKLTKKRTYKAVITFKGNKFYSKVTKKVKIVIK